MPRYKRKSSVMCTTKGKRKDKKGANTISPTVDSSDDYSSVECSVDEELESVPEIEDTDESIADNAEHQRMDAATQCLLAGAVEVGDTLHPNARNVRRQSP
jgi:hypothetical protein